MRGTTQESSVLRSCCCCCCYVASVMSDSVRHHRQQPTRLPRPWDSTGKNTGVGCHFLLQCMKVKSESEVTQSCLTLPTPWTAAYQAPPSMGFSRQEYWSGVPSPSLEKLADIKGRELRMECLRVINSDQFPSFFFLLERHFSNILGNHNQQIIYHK